MNLKEMPLFFLDLQTTGTKPESGAHILEIAWADNNGPVESSLVQLPNDEKIPYRIQLITGIFNEDMASARSIEELFLVFEERFQNHPCVIHFAQFEKPFLAEAFKKIEKENKLEILCTHEIAKRLLPNLPTRGIKGLAGYFGFPSTDFKRSAQQVEATRAIWLGLTELLQEQGVETHQQLQDWLAVTPKTSRTKYEYPLPKEKRLSLPDEPGVYRMVSKWDEILYVGKATSLKDRVNSYFRGQKNRDPRKLEMLTQVYDLKVTVCGSPLEAALLETDEIKRLDPRYNISLKASKRGLVFFNRDFTEMDFEQNEEFYFGPFSSSVVFESLRNLSSCVVSGDFHDHIFYEQIDGLLVKEGVATFCERYGFSIGKINMRTLLALGVWWNRQYDFTTEDEDNITDESLDNPLELEDTEIVLTAEDIADKIERHITRAGKTYLRSKELTRILNADIEFKTVEDDRCYQLKVRKGVVAAEAAVERVQKINLWNNLDINTYDRMSVLLMELGKIRTASGEVMVRTL
ncbi:MAG: exonuclease domain-containing protein [Bdellovibrio sp.]